MTKPYSKDLRIKQNKKVKDTDIISIDSTRGCKNNCYECFAKRVCALGKKNFDIPVNVEKLIGKKHDNLTYRLGNAGDPATDWSNAEKLIKKYNLKNVFATTKLQKIKGFTGLIKKLQVSIDPLNKKHFYKSLDNVEKILKKYPDIKIVLRIRSCSSNDPKINILQQEAVTFANLYNLPVLETRLRFLRNKAFTDLNLNKEDYERRDGYHRPKNGLRFLVGASHHYVCDLMGEKCKGCQNCITLFKKTFKRKSKSKSVVKRPNTGVYYEKIL